MEKTLLKTTEAPRTQRNSRSELGAAGISRILNCFHRSTINPVRLGETGGNGAVGSCRARESRKGVGHVLRSVLSQGSQHLSGGTWLLTIILPAPVETTSPGPSCSVGKLTGVSACGGGGTSSLFSRKDARNSATAERRKITAPFSPAGNTFGSFGPQSPASPSIALSPPAPQRTWPQRTTVAGTSNKPTLRSVNNIAS